MFFLFRKYKIDPVDREGKRKRLRVQIFTTENSNKTNKLRFTDKKNVLSLQHD